MKKWSRHFYQPCLPIGEDGKRVTGSKEHIALSRRAAAEGMVLLKNEEHVLPLTKGQKVALFGKGCADYVKGGGGSGDVTVAYVTNLIRGMREKEQLGKTQIFEPLAAYYEKYVEEEYAKGAVPGMVAEPEVPKELLKNARIFTDTAVISICRFSGENWDRTISGVDEEKQKSEFSDIESDLVAAAAKIFERGDYYLSAAEEKMVEDVKKVFPKVIVVMNVGGVVDSTWFAEDPKIQAVLMAWQGGMEGGGAAADLLCADADPSGKLTDTFAKRLEDYPSSDGFHESVNYVDYKEDIYVGYRYFETIPGAAEKVNYPFGYGLSYTEFAMMPDLVFMEEEAVEVFCKVKNIGIYPGKEVVQLYVEAPQGKLGKPARVLKAYEKTKLLLPGESQTLRLIVPVSSLASYDDTRKISKSAYILEQGEYAFYLGNSVRNAEKLKESFFVEKDTVVEQLTEKCAPNLLKERMLADGSMEALPVDPSAVRISPWDEEITPRYFPDVTAEKGLRLGEVPKEHQLEEVADEKLDLEEFLDQLSAEEMIHLLCGQPNTGVANTFGFGNLSKYGVPNVMTADGPAGLRIRPECGVCTTAFPCATLLACSWNTDLVEEVGAAGGAEVVENNIGVWLTPAMNIHRSPLCGRNFEYYSEDPLIAGKTGAAMVRGIQSQKVAASVKHFACNNKETARFESDSRVSERALREIYLKGFEIVVKESDPWTIMSSYNIVNGIRSSERKDLLTGILRDEWGFGGLVTTDWWNHAEQYLEIQAGNDVKMGCGYPERLKRDYEEGRISKEEIRTSAKRMLELILKIE